MFNPYLTLTGIPLLSNSPLTHDPFHHVSAPKEPVTRIINTCYLWREDGPLVRRVKDASKFRDS
jgi:hypothetical protein